MPGLPAARWKNRLQDQPWKRNRKKEVVRMIQVGKKVPDFTSPGYYKGKFINMKLSGYLGKWFILIKIVSSLS